MNVWYSRPVIFVESVERSIAFYTEKLGFTESSRYEEEGKILVAQVDREDCEILLNCQQPEKTGRSRMFISIDIGPLQALRAEFEAAGRADQGWLVGLRHDDYRRPRRQRTVLPLSERRGSSNQHPSAETRAAPIRAVACYAFPANCRRTYCRIPPCW